MTIYIIQSKNKTEQDAQWNDVCGEISFQRACKILVERAELYPYCEFQIKELHTGQNPSIYLIEGKSHGEWVSIFAETNRDTADNDREALITLYHYEDARVKVIKLFQN